MMRNHKIVSTVSATSLLGFVAQRIFTTFFFSYFFNLTLALFYFVVTPPPPLKPLPASARATLRDCRPSPTHTRAPGVDLFYPLLRHHACLTDISPHPDKITFPVNR